MKKLILTLITPLLLATATPVYAQEFDVAAKHAIAIEANTGKLLPNWLQFIWSMRPWNKEKFL